MAAERMKVDYDTEEEGKIKKRIRKEVKRVRNENPNVMATAQAYLLRSCYTQNNRLK